MAYTSLDSPAFFDKYRKEQIQIVSHADMSCGKDIGVGVGIDCHDELGIFHANEVLLGP